MRFGAQQRSEGGVDFAIWAPSADLIELLLEQGRKPAERDAEGWWHAFDGDADALTRYRWLVDGKLCVPDPASRCNPDGPHAVSVVTDPREYEWTCNWSGRPWHETVIYQLHIGTFTPDGTFTAAASRLERLAELGVSAIQLMPLASFGGAFGWGYDGVLPFAPNPAYGTPGELKAFVDAAHRQGLSVFLDVVYNHFGPDGNFLPKYAPQFESRCHQTPWGRAINFDGEGSKFVREFVIQNALYWLEEFRFDGLRLDAVHAMIDDGQPHIVEELTRRVRASVGNRHVHIILENDHNNPARVGFAPELCEGQWNGDFHHCVHVLLTGEKRSYYAEYADAPIERLGRVLTLGFTREGAEEARPDRQARRDATSTMSLQNSVNFLQCHDQIGNRAFGERLNVLASPEAWRLVTALLALCPAVPMLFMGQEFNSRHPFLYFADVKPEMREAIRAGRREEFRDAPSGAAADRGEPPDPCDRETFLQSIIEQPDELGPIQREALRWTADLLQRRRDKLTSLLPELLVGRHEYQRFSASGLAVTWRFAKGRSFEMRINLGAEPVDLELPNIASPVLIVGSVSRRSMGAWSGIWWWNHA